MSKCAVCETKLDGQVVVWETQDKPINICSVCYPRLSLTKVSGPTWAQEVGRFLIGSAFGATAFLIIIQFVP